MAKKGLNIYQRKDGHGRWEGRYKCGYTADGKVRYASVYGKSYSAVKELLEEKIAALRNNTECHVHFTVGELFDKLLSDIKNKVKESTLANYNMKLNKHILPYFSGIKYEKLTVEKINAFIDEKINSGLSSKYVADMVVLLKTAAKYAAKCFGCVNRIDNVTLPKVNKSKEAAMLSDDEQLKLKKYIFEHQTASNICVLLALSTGMRIGEICGLKCGDIDFKKSIITVRHTVQRIIDTSNGGTKIIVMSPKSITSVRDIPIPDYLVPIIKNIITADSNYLLSGSSAVTEPRTMQNRFKKLLKSANLTNVNFHSLRHAFATKCVAIGVDVKTLSEILGHSSVEITLNRYVHSSAERKKHCMKIFSDSLSVS